MNAFECDSFFQMAEPESHSDKVLREYMEMMNSSRSAASSSSEQALRCSESSSQRRPGKHSNDPHIVSAAQVSGMTPKEAYRFLRGVVPEVLAGRGVCFYFIFEA